MIPKKIKPKVDELRPIALTNIDYKINMSAIKNHIEEQVTENEENKETQAGFTKKGKIEDNIFILQHCIEYSKKNKKPLIVISIDFRKAYDSVKREAMMEMLKEYKINEDIIETIASTYQNDITTLNYAEEKVDLEITSGIRQGCTNSATLFKLITYKIIERMEMENGYKDKDLDIKALFFADDGLILAQSIEQAKINIEVITEVGEKFGLGINIDKSCIIIYHMQEKPNEISNIKVVEDIKYLGVTIGTGRDIFKKHKEETINKARRMAKITYSIIEKSCNRLLIGKTYWKGVVLPSILYANPIINWNETEIKELQVIENSVYRTILGGRRYTPIATMRGEIGSSTMKRRIYEARLLYMNNIKSRDNLLLKKILQIEEEDKNSKWIKTSSTYQTILHLNEKDINNMSKLEIKEWSRKWDENEWKKELEEKSTLKIYRKWRKEIKEREYDNRNESKILFLARANSLPLNARVRKDNKACDVCKEEEDLVHFLLYCKLNKHEKVLDKYKDTNDEDKIGKFLFNEKDIKENSKTLHRMWIKREKARKDN